MIGWKFNLGYIFIKRPMPLKAYLIRHELDYFKWGGSRFQGPNTTKRVLSTSLVSRSVFQTPLSSVCLPNSSVNTWTADSFWTSNVALNPFFEPVIRFADADRTRSVHKDNIIVIYYPFYRPSTVPKKRLTFSEYYCNKLFIFYLIA